MPRTDPKMVATAMELMRTTTLDKRAILCIYLLLFRRFVLEVQQHPAILSKAPQQCGRRSRRLSTTATKLVDGRRSVETAGTCGRAMSLRVAICERYGQSEESARRPGRSSV